MIGELFYLLAEATGDKEFRFYKFFSLLTILDNIADPPVSPGLHSISGRQSLLLPPLRSLNVAVSWCPVFLLGPFSPVITAAARPTIALVGFSYLVVDGYHWYDLFACELINFFIQLFDHIE